MVARKSLRWLWRILLLAPATCGWILLTLPGSHLLNPVVAHQLHVQIMGGCAVLGPMPSPGAGPLASFLPDGGEETDREVQPDPGDVEWVTLMLDVVEHGSVLAVVPSWFGTHVIIANWLVAAVLSTLALPFLNGLRFLHRRRSRRRQNRCEICGYSLTGNTSGVCPECGTAAHSAPPSTR